MQFDKTPLVIEDRRVKLCSKCKVEKAAWQFGRLASSEDGLARWCRGCWREYRACAGGGNEKVEAAPFDRRGYMREYMKAYRARRAK